GAQRAVAGTVRPAPGARRGTRRRCHLPRRPATRRQRLLSPLLHWRRPGREREEGRRMAQWGRALAASYEPCRLRHRTHGRTEYLATRLLPPWKRPHVHALYGFSRYTDAIVDAFAGASGGDRKPRLR